jgi:hypothetical protein
MEMRTIETQVFAYEELSETAQAQARDWFRQHNTFYAEFVIDDAKAIAALMGVEIGYVYYSGFCSQGDGACFEGRFGYHKGCRLAVAAHAPEDTKLQKIASRWQELQRRHFYKVTGSVRQSGHYMHEMCTHFDVSPASAEDNCADILWDLMRWIYAQLESEYEYQNSDENVVETILANGYKFDTDGNIA